MYLKFCEYYMYRISKNKLEILDDSSTYEYDK